MNTQHTAILLTITLALWACDSSSDGDSGEGRVLDAGTGGSASGGGNMGGGAGGEVGAGGAGGGTATGGAGGEVGAGGVAAGATGGQTGTGGAGGAGCLAPGTYDRTLTLMGMGGAYDQAYRLHIPPNEQPGAPIIFQLHGAGGTIEKMETVTGLYAVADEAGFIAVTPFAAPAGEEVGAWNGGAGPNETPHVQILTRLIDEVVSETGCGDADKVFFAGQSSGGIMSYRMACEASDRVRGVIVNAGFLADESGGMTAFECADNRRPISILHMHGLLDNNVPYEGRGDRFPSIEDEIATWRAWNNCEAPGTDEEAVEGVRRRAWQCDGNTVIELLTIAEHGHPWPNSPPETAGEAQGPITDLVDGTQELRRFVEAELQRGGGMDGAGGMDGVGGAGDAAPFEQGANGLFAGQSFFVPVARAFGIAAEGGDFPNHAINAVFAPGVQGSPQALWEDEARRAEIEAVLATGDIDLFGITIGPLNEDNPAEFYGRWIDLAVQHNPDITIFIGFPYLQGGATQPTADYEASIVQGGEAFFGLVESLREFYAGTDIVYFNYGLVLSEMKASFEAGELPDIDALAPPRGGQPDDQTSYLFNDSSPGHAGPMAEHVCGLVWLHLLYGAEIGPFIDPAYDAEDVERIVTEVVRQNAPYRAAPE